MIAVFVALLQHVISVPAALAVVYPRFRLAVSVSSRRQLPVSSSFRVPQVNSNVLLVMSEQELQKLAVDLGQGSYRGKQLHHLVYKIKVKEIENFVQLPQAFRNNLQEAGWTVGCLQVYRTVTAANGTVKLLIKLEDNRLIETVGIPAEDKKGSMQLTACVSSQVGRPLRCSFCATGKGGFSRNLKRHEIIGQDVQIGQRMITISTVGVPSTIKKLASHKLHSTLAVREAIVPSAKSYPLEAIMKGCRDYFVEISRQWAAGVNDQVERDVELAELLREWGPGHHVNLIPFNPIQGSDYECPYKKAVLAFAGALESHEITVSTRQAGGVDASAACGQLRNEFQKRPLQVDSDRLQSESDIAIAC